MVFFVLLFWDKLSLSLAHILGMEESRESVWPMNLFGWAVCVCIGGGSNWLSARIRFSTFPFLLLMIFEKERNAHVCWLKSNKPKWTKKCWLTAWTWKGPDYFNTIILVQWYAYLSCESILLFCINLSFLILINFFVLFCVKPLNFFFNWYCKECCIWCWLINGKSTIIFHFWFVLIFTNSFLSQNPFSYCLC